MNFVFIFVSQFLFLCLPQNKANAVVIPPNNNSKLFVTGELGEYPSVFYNKTDNYYPLYQRGPCGKLMWIEADDHDSSTGVCRCIQSPLGLRQLLHWQPSDRCYFQYDQGPCKMNEWLTYNKQTQSPECTNNPCPTTKLEKDMDIDMQSLVDLETDFYFVDDSDNTTCLRNKLDLTTWHLELNKWGVSRFVFHNETQKFFPLGEQGPCPIYMEPMRRRNSPLLAFGECVCRTLVGNGQRPTIHWKPTDRCYFAYTQGPCATGEWLVGNAFQGACEKNLCSKITPAVNKEEDYANPVLKPDLQFFISDSNGTCHETNTTAYCTEGKKFFLGEHGVSSGCFDIGINGEPRYLGGSGVGVSSDQGCGEDYTWDQSGKCVRKVASFG